MAGEHRETDTKRGKFSGVFRRVFVCVCFRMFTKREENYTLNIEVLP